jgi:hypothetical protein
VLAGSFGKPMPAFDVQIRAAEGSVVQRGSLPGGSAEGKISIPLEHSVSEVPNATVCIRGHTTRTAFGGVATDAGGARVAGHPQHGIFRIEYMRAGRESWWSMFSEISRRFGYAKASVIGTWTLPALVVMALMLYALVGAVLWRFVVSR